MWGVNWPRRKNTPLFLPGETRVLIAKMNSTYTAAVISSSEKSSSKHSANSTVGFDLASVERTTLVGGGVRLSSSEKSLPAALKCLFCCYALSRAYRKAYSSSGSASGFELGTLWVLMNSSIALKKAYLQRLYNSGGFREKTNSFLAALSSTSSASPA